MTLQNRRMRGKWLAVLMVLLCLALLAAGCGEEKKMPETKGAYAVITDDAGRTVSLDAKPQRIVPLSASFLEPLHAVNAPVVARVAAKTGIPEEDKSLPEVGNVYNINIEKVIAAKPDLIIAYKGMNDKYVSSFESNHIPVIVLEMRTYEQVKNTVKVMGVLSGFPDKGRQLIADMDNQMKAVQAKLPKDGKRIAILHSTSQSVTVQLENSIAGSAAELLGLKNIAAGMTPLQSNPTAAPYSLETLAAANPDLIFVTTMGKMETVRDAMMKNVESNPAWQALPAVQDGRVYFLPQEQFLLSPGIHYPEAVAYMAKLAYPELFS